MKVCNFSDTHGFDVSWILQGIEADILIHGGDWGNYGTIGEFQKFVLELVSVKDQFNGNIVLVNGNHDLAFKTHYSWARELLKENGIHYLEDSMVTIDGVRIYGSPWTIWDNKSSADHWAFGKMRASEDIREKWMFIPKDLDILSTHQPPYDILDSTVYEPEYDLDGNCIRAGHTRYYGCYDLRLEVLKKKPKHMTVSHIHDSYGEMEYEGIKFHNGASCTEQYSPKNKPLVWEL